MALDRYLLDMQHRILETAASTSHTMYYKSRWLEYPILHKLVRALRFLAHGQSSQMDKVWRFPQKKKENDQDSSGTAYNRLSVTLKHNGKIQN